MSITENQTDDVSVSSTTESAAERQPQSVTPAATDSPQPAPCNADDFMDEADADAVAERLRQLGYL